MRVIWPAPIKIKLLSYHSKHFTSEETTRYIHNIVVKAEKTLLNETVSVWYKEKEGSYKGISRIVVDRFKIYFKRTNNQIVVIGIEFPRES